MPRITTVNARTQLQSTIDRFTKKTCKAVGATFSWMINVTGTQNFKEFAEKYINNKLGILLLHRCTNQMEKQLLATSKSGGAWDGRNWNCPPFPGYNLYYEVRIFYLIASIWVIKY